MARHGGRSEGKTAAASLRALRLLETEPATQLVDKPLRVLTPLIADGYAEISHRWDEVANGKLWRCEKVSITEAGRAFLKRIEAQ